jgi:hypothetical protein
MFCPISLLESFAPGVSAHVFRRIASTSVMGRTQAYHKHFTLALAATQNMVDIAIGSGFVEQPAHNATQVSDLGVPFLFSLGQR